MNHGTTSLSALTRTLPEGRRGQALALAMLVVALGLAWLLVLGPVWTRYADRAQGLELQRATLARMQRLATSLPALRQAATTSAPGPSQLIDGTTDAVASANLQDMLQKIATETGSEITSVENAAPTPAGRYRRIGLHVVATAPFPILVRLLTRLEQATPAIVIDGLHLRASEDTNGTSAMDADMLIHAFRRTDGTQPSTPSRNDTP
ncbi:type II secretion system protein GspM [Gluconacetobacter takamatsuzukensis]|uniref:General secretion pathway protein GspM n=1 Tax=Gluconacetobacter takamatsuzukensis TaxID=1286190 RepID=A0A7W4KEF3_9PROT|nr:type II secretion system protein GspM [Gluconacetobacter takamatsuzukensis]MBB2205320.1 general secretion pathway protein GspM [Gluconacetobacter takamatsuzukensis]